MATLIRLLAAALVCVAIAAPAARAATTESRCLAIAQSLPAAVPVAYVKVQDGLEPPVAQEVTIRFVGHATFLITSPKGVTIATDYAGYAGPGRHPARRHHEPRASVALHRQPRSAHRIRAARLEPGRRQGGPSSHRRRRADPQRHDRHPPLRDGRAGRQLDLHLRGGAIFASAISGISTRCSTPEDLGQIGQLDVVMVPVDGSYTMSQDAMLETLKVLQSAAHPADALFHFGDAEPFPCPARRRLRRRAFELAGDQGVGRNAAGAAEGAGAAWVLRP